MKKILFVIFLLPVISVNGQRIIFSQGLDVVIPHGILKSSANTGFGQSFRCDLIFNKYLVGIGTVGFMSFGQKTYTTTAPPASISTKTRMIPIQAGMKFYVMHNPSKKSGIYLSGETGLNILINKSTLNGTNENIPTEYDFGYAFGAGYIINRFELSYRQQFVKPSGKTINYSGFRLAWLLSKPN